MARPSVDGLERDLRGRARVMRVDIETPAAALLAARYDIQATPTYLLVDGHGREVWRKVGGTPPRMEIEAHLADMAR